MEYKIEKEQIEKLLNYLSTKPWVEVNDLIVNLLNLSKQNQKE